MFCNQDCPSNDVTYTLYKVVNIVVDFHVDRRVRLSSYTSIVRLEGLWFSVRALGCHLTVFIYRVSDQGQCLQGISKGG